MRGNLGNYWSWLRRCIALVWLYQGAWLKVIAVDSHHLSIVEAAVPWGSPRFWIGSIGVFESLLAIWFLSEWRLRWCAIMQVALLAVMNAGGILSAGDKIPDPVGMVLMNLVFALAILGAGGVWRDRE